MKVLVGVVLSAASSVLGCAHEQRPPAAQEATAPPVAVAPLSTDTSPPRVAPMTPASGVGEARPTAPPVQLDPQRDKATSKADEESIIEIRQLLAKDTSLSSSARDITIVVKDGRVWLRGTVSTAAERARIERAARQAVNVIQVRNELSAGE